MGSIRESQKGTHMKKNYLLAPGPVQVPAEVLLSMSKPLVHHRTKQFQNLVKDNQVLLQRLFATQTSVITFTSSGTGAMEASIANTHSSDEEVLVLNTGKFGERFANIAKTYGLKVHELTYEWGTPADPKDVQEYLQKNPQIVSVMMQHSETSSATINPLKEIADVVHATDAILIVDAITSMGVVPVLCDQWHLDVVVAGSQKSLMLPPGLSFLWMSQKAWQRNAHAGLPRFYFDALKEKKALEKNSTAWTPAISLFEGLNTALYMMQKYGYENLFKRNEQLMKSLHAGFKALGMKLLSKSPSVSVTAAFLPQDIDGEKVLETMKEVYGVTVAGGQDHLKGKILRVGTLGYVDSSDIIVFFATLESTLQKMHYPIVWGESVAAAEEVFASSF